jgi:hypothetical protein
MLHIKPLGIIFKAESTVQSCPGALHLHRKAALSTLAPHSIPSPTRNLGPTTSCSRAQQISRHLSTTTSPLVTMSQLPISERGHHGNAPGTYAVRKNGPPNTLEHRIYIEKDGVPVSPFHDIPLYANEQQTVLNMIVEIPRWTNAKMEVCNFYSATPW